VLCACRSVLLFLFSYCFLFVATWRYPRLPWPVVTAALGILVGWLSSNGVLGSGDAPVFQTLGDKYGKESLSPNLLKWGLEVNEVPFAVHASSISDTPDPISSHVVLC
jgi:hypothetical protein